MPLTGAVLLRLCYILLCDQHCKVFSVVFFCFYDRFIYAVLCICSRYSGRESPCILLNIPDGHVKEMPTTGSKHKPAAVTEGSQEPPKKPLSAKEVFVCFCCLCLTFTAVFVCSFYSVNSMLIMRLKQVASFVTSVTFLMFIL